MATVLTHVAKKERFHLPATASESIIEASDGNLRKALLVFEAMKMQRPDLEGDIDVARPDWETYCAKVADMILQEQSASRLLEVRAKIYVSWSETASDCLLTTRRNSCPTAFRHMSCSR